MKTLATILFSVGLLAGCATHRGNPPVCGGSQDSGITRSATSVKLKARTSTPMLYWTSDHYVVLMSPDSVVELVQSWVAEELYSRHAPTLLDWIRADLPLADDTDLNKYSIRNTRLESLPRYIAAALLESGDASIVDLWQLDNEKNLSEMQLVRLATSGGEWRYFCEPAGQEILWVNDMIVSLPTQGSPNNQLELARRFAARLDSGV